MTDTATARVDLATTLAGATLRTPIMVASGCGGWGPELAWFADLSALGALVTPTVTRNGGPGAPVPRVAETPSGLLANTGLPGPGVDAFLSLDLPRLLSAGVRTIVSIGGSTLGEYAELARRIGETPGITGIEVHLATVSDPITAARAVSVVRRDTAAGVPVFAKLWPGSGSALVDLATTALDSGADAVVVPASVPGIALHAASLRPLLGAGAGDLGGPALLPHGLHAVWEVREALPEAVIVAVGGVTSGADALHYLACGANAVQVGSATYADPTCWLRITQELHRALAARGLGTASAAVGLARPRHDVPTIPSADRSSTGDA